MACNCVRIQSGTSCRATNIFEINTLPAATDNIHMLHLTAFRSSNITHGLGLGRILWRDLNIGIPILTQLTITAVYIVF